MRSSAMNRKLSEWAKRDPEQLTDGEMRQAIANLDKLRSAIETEQKRREVESSRWQECPECNGTFVNLQLHRWWWHGKTSPPPQAYRKLRSELRGIAQALIPILERGQTQSPLGHSISLLTPGAIRTELQRWLNHCDTADLTDDDRRKLAAVSRDFAEAITSLPMTFVADDAELDEIVQGELGDVSALLLVMSGGIDDGLSDLFQR